jgi:hypothetical protein
MRKVHVSELALGQRFAFSPQSLSRYVALAVEPDPSGRKDSANVVYGAVGPLYDGATRTGELAVSSVFVEDVQEFLPAADRAAIVKTLRRAVTEGTGGLSRDAAACLALLREDIPAVVQMPAPIAPGFPPAAPVAPVRDAAAIREDSIVDGLRRALVSALEGSGPLSTSETWVTHSDQGPQRVRVSTWPEWFPAALDALEHAGIKRHELNLRDGM